MPTRIDALTEPQRARMDEWADRWIDIGLRTGDADRARFEEAAKRCYEAAGIPWHNNVVWVPSPIVGAIASPVAALVIAISRRRQPPVRGAVDGAVDGAVNDAVDGAVNDAVNGAVRGAVNDAVNGAVDDAVDGAVRDAVNGAVNDAVNDAVRQSIRNLWNHYFGGQFWPGYYWWGGAWTSFFREVCDLELPGDLWDRARAYEATIESACYWWPHRDFIMVCERPLEIHREQIGPRGFGSHRLHREDGPAVQFRDGWGVYSWHGTRVPASLIEGAGWSVERIMREPNAEVRRCAVERIGWDRFVTDAGLRVVDEASDPANPGHVLTLCDGADQVYGAPVRVLLCTNASPERDGKRRRFGLTVPASIGDAVEAAAWSFNVSKSEYLQLERAT